MNVDPLAERHFYNSPYMYCNNNPVVFLDPDGRDMITFTGTDAAALVKTIQGALETGGAWSIEFEWATGSLYAEKDVYDAFEGSGGGGFGYQEEGAIGREILNFKIRLLDRFRKSGLDPFAPVSQQNANQEIEKIINSVQGLREYWEAAGKPSFNFGGRSSEGLRGFTQDGHMQIYNGAFSNNFWLASTLFHEITHAYQDRYSTLSRNEAERQAYATEWRLADRQLRVAYSTKYKSVWNHLHLYQGLSIPIYPY